VPSKLINCILLVRSGSHIITSLTALGLDSLTLSKKPSEP